MSSSAHRAIALAAVAATAIASGCRDSGVGPKPGVPISCPATSPVMTLAPGQVTTITDPQAMGCIRLAGATTGSTYLFVPYNANRDKNVTQPFRIAVSPGSFAASVAPAASVSPTPPVAARAIFDDVVYRDPIEAGIRAAERELYRTRSLAVPRAPGSAAVAPSFSTLPTTFTLGQRLSLFVPDTSTVPKYCTAFETITAYVKSIGIHGVVVQDSAAPAGGFSAAQFDSIATEFDRLVWPADSAHFGLPSDIDLNQRVVLLITPLVNALTPRASTGFTAGFFFSGDLYTSGCRGSNGGELFYLIAPDPVGTINGNPRGTTFVRETIRGVVAHEFQHMINAGNRLFVTPGPPEDVWLDEGLAHFAEEFVGRAARGYADMRLLSFADTQNPISPSDYPAFFRQNFARARTYLVAPDTTGPTHDRWPGDPQGPSQLGYRGAAWAFLRWVADHHAAADVAAFTRRLASGPLVGVANLLAAANNVPFDQLVGPWLVSLYADHNGIPLLDPVKYQYQSWDFRNALAGANAGSYPLRVTPIGVGVSLAGQLASSSGSFYLLTNSGSTPATVVQMAAQDGTAVSFVGAGMAVLRVN